MQPAKERFIQATPCLGFARVVPSGSDQGLLRGQHAAPILTLSTVSGFFLGAGLPVLEPALTATDDLSRLRPGCATFAQFRRYQSSTTLSTLSPTLFDTTATTTRIEPQALPHARELGCSGNHVTAPVRLVFSLPGMKPHARLWRRGRNLAQVLWPLIAPFAPHLPRKAHLQIVACSRVYRGNDGIPEILLTIDHPAVFDFSVWVRDQGHSVSLRLTSVAPGMSITAIVASCFPHRRYANTLLDAVRADDQPVRRNGMIVSVCDDWRRDESYPLADWHFVLCGCGMLQFPLEVPEMLLSLPAPCLDSNHPQHSHVEEVCRHRFMSQFMSSCARYIQWLCESVTDKHIRVILPGRGVCRLRWQHSIAPTAEELRSTIAEIWPDLSLYAILDTFSFQQDACIFLVQGSARLYTAWFLMDPYSAATDVRLVPCGFHPVSCLPTPGHMPPSCNAMVPGAFFAMHLVRRHKHPELRIILPPSSHGSRPLMIRQIRRSSALPYRPTYVLKTKSSLFFPTL